ncbi:MAG: transposase [Candidatus Marinimicrobia bacterium]|nr:transposase [Candidatus Neomarinimicrobiota bacterium]
MFFCGIDWSDKGFIAVIVDPLGKVVKKFIVRNSAKEFDKFIDKIRIVTSPQNPADNVSDMLFTIETPNLAIVDYLMENGYTVYAVNPKSVDRYRDRYRISGAKDDFFPACRQTGMHSYWQTYSGLIKTNTDLFPLEVIWQEN